MSNTSKFVQLARDFGTTPSSRFVLTFRVCKLQLLGNVSEILPMSLFLLRFKTFKVLLVEDNKHWGIVPFMELLDRSRTPRAAALHIDSGICPWNLLLERDKKALSESRLNKKSSLVQQSGNYSLTSPNNNNMEGKLGVVPGVGWS